MLSRKLKSWLRQKGSKVQIIKTVILCVLEFFWIKTGKPPLTGRHKSFTAAVKELKRRDGKIIVETGTIRSEDSRHSDGWSTFVWGWYAKKVNGSVHTVDKSKKAIEICKKITRQFKPYICYHCADSVEFLKNFSGKIDLFYSDSGGTRDISLAEIKQAENNFHENSLILFDDTTISLESKIEGKGHMAVEYLLKRGWKISSFIKDQIMMEKRGQSDFS